MSRIQFVGNSIFFVVAFIFLSVPTTAHAVERHWRGNGGDASVSTAANWVGGVAPTNGSDVFIATSTGTVYWDSAAPSQVRSITSTSTTVLQLARSVEATSSIEINQGTTLTASTTITLTPSGSGPNAFKVFGTYNPNSSTVTYTSTSTTDVASTTFAVVNFNGATTFSLVGSTTATSTLTVASGATLDTLGQRLNLVKASGTGATAPMVNNGTFHGTGSTVAYAFQNGATDVATGVYSTLSFGSAVTYTLVGSTTATSTLTVPNGTTLSLGGQTLTLTKASGTGATAPLVNNGTFSAMGSTINYSFQTGATDISSSTFSTLNFNGAATYSLVGSSTATSTLTIASGATLDTGGYTLNLVKPSGTGSSAPLVNNGTFHGTGSTVSYAFQSGTSDIASGVYSSLSLNSAITYNLAGSTTATSTLTVPNGTTLSLAGKTLTLTKVSGTGSSAPLVNNGTLVPAGSTVNYSFQTGATDVSSTTYSTVNFNGAITYTLVGSTTATSTLTVSNGTTLSLGANTLTLTKASGLTTSAPFLVYGTFNADAGTVVYSFQTGNTDIASTTYTRLTLNAAVTYSLPGTTTATSTVTIASGTTLSLGAYNFSMSGATFTNNGTLTESGTGVFRMAATSSFITDSNYSSIVTYANPGTAYVTVTDQNANKSGSSADTITVTASASDPSNSLSVTLTETGNATGIFRGSFPTVLVANAVTTDSNLEINGNTLLSMSYTDAKSSGDVKVYTIPATGNQTNNSTSGGTPPGPTGGSPSSGAPAPVATTPPVTTPVSQTLSTYVFPSILEAPISYVPSLKGVIEALGTTKEAQSLIDNYKAVYGKVPKTEAQWTDTVRLAEGLPPVTRNVKAEKSNATVFKKLFKRAPATTVADQTAVLMLTYGMRPESRSLESEKAGIAKFRKTYKKAPKTNADWNAVRAYAYSGVK